MSFYTPRLVPRCLGDMPRFPLRPRCSSGRRRRRMRPAARRTLLGALTLALLAAHAGATGRSPSGWRWHHHHVRRPADGGAWEASPVPAAEDVGARMSEQGSSGATPGSDGRVEAGGEVKSEGDTCTLDPPPQGDADQVGGSEEDDPRGSAFCPGFGAREMGGDGSERPCPHSKASRCARGCEAHGTCNQELGRCDCPRGRTGEACEAGSAEPFERSPFDDQPPFCLNDCNGRGTCVFGFCHCTPGFFGSDCSLWLDAEEKPRLIDDEWRGRRPSPRVFVYNLPPEYNVYFDARKLDRNAEIFFYERMLSSHHRTADAAEADLFMIPISTRLSEQVYGRHGRVIETAAEYIEKTWPQHVARNDWRDHVVFFTGDWGVCEFFNNFGGEGKRFPDFIAKGIMLTFWGMRERSDRYFGGGPCYFPGKDVLIPPLNSYNFRELSPFFPDAFAAKMGTRHVPFDVKRRDPVFIPGAEDGGALVTSYDNEKRIETVETGANPVRRWLLYFAGKTEGGNREGYLGRANAKRVFAGREAEGIRFVERDNLHYEDNMAASTFCFAPTGDGWGRRTTLAAMFGCIPVIVQDGVSQPFDELLPYHKFSIRVDEKDLEKIPEMLRKIPDTCEGLGSEELCIPRMREQLACAVRSFLWSSVFGSAFGEGGEDDAFAVTMLALQHRLATHVKPHGHAIWTPRLPISDACELPTALSCLRMDQPVCRFPCSEAKQRHSERHKLRAAGTMWPVGGAVNACAKLEVREGERTCETDQERAGQPTYTDEINQGRAK